MTRFAEIRGLSDLERLSRELREAGVQGKGLKRELAKELNRETKLTRKVMRAEILTGLPRSGGLARDVQSKTRFTTSTSTSGRNVGVRIKVRSKRTIRRMNATGTFRHPVFGREGSWVTQSAGVEKGFLDKPFQEARPALVQSARQAIARIRARIL